MYGGELTKTGQCAPGIMKQPTITERLSSEKQRLESRLEEVNKALEALNKNPEIAEVINIISKVSY